MVIHENVGMLHVEKSITSSDTKLSSFDSNAFVKCICFDLNAISEMDSATRLYRARKTTMEMLKDRGYHIPKENWMTLEAFLSHYGTEVRRDALTQIFHKPQDHTEQIFVYFAEDAKVGVDAIKTLYDKMKAENVKRALMVIIGKLSPFVKSSLSQMESQQKVEVFREQELLVNITKHALVPEHSVLTDSEKKTLLEQYKLTEAQLPKILMTDPVARYFGLEKGQVVKIIRSSETAGRYVTYRIAS